MLINILTACSETTLEWLVVISRSFRPIVPSLTHLASGWLGNRYAKYEAVFHLERFEHFSLVLYFMIFTRSSGHNYHKPPFSRFLPKNNIQYTMFLFVWFIFSFFFSNFLFFHFFSNFIFFICFLFLFSFCHWFFIFCFDFLLLWFFCFDFFVLIFLSIFQLFSFVYIRFSFVFHLFFTCFSFVFHSFFSFFFFHFFCDFFFDFCFYFFFQFFIWLFTNIIWLEFYIWNLRTELSLVYFFGRDRDTEIDLRDFSAKLLIRPQSKTEKTNSKHKP